MKFFIVPLFFMIFIISSASAQESAGRILSTPVEKNSPWGVDPLALKTKDDKKFFFELGAGYGLKFGNTNSNDIDAGTTLKYNDGLFELIVHAEMHYGEMSGVVSENNFSSNINFDYFIIPRLEIFVFSKFEYDSMAGIIFRNNTGAGLKFVIFKNWLWLMDISAAPTFQYELQINKPGLIEPRLSFRYRLGIQPVKQVQFNFILYYVPDMIEFSDYRYDADTYFKFTLIESLTGAGTGLYLNIGYKRKFNSVPVPGKQRSDNNFYTTVSVKL